MSMSFDRLMADALQRTRTGDLTGATAAIQAALRGGMAARAAGGTVERADGGDACVIDVEARVIDVEASVVDVDHAPPASRHAPDAGGFIGGVHVHAAGTREYKLFVPPGWHGRRLPLVVMLHGCTQDPDDFAAGTRMNEAALERGFFVLYPAQAQNANPSRCWNWFKHNHQARGRGEPALLADLTRTVIERYGIDTRHVHVAGLSAGGAMAAILGDAYPELYAAVGVHSGLPPGSATNVKTAFEAMRGADGPAVRRGATPPTIVFHGDQDTTVHPLNGQRLAAAGAGEGAPERERLRSENGREYTRHVYRDASGRTVTEHWVVHGAGHAWSGGSPRGSYTDATGPDATDEMLRFFFSHPLRGGA